MKEYSSHWEWLKRLNRNVPIPSHWTKCVAEQDNPYTSSIIHWKPPSKATEITLMMKCINVSIYNRFMLIVLFDVIYCLTVTSKHSQLHTNGKQIKWYFHCSTMETNWKQKKKKKQEKKVSKSRVIQQNHWRCPSCRNFGWMESAKRKLKKNGATGTDTVHRSDKLGM